MLQEAGHDDLDANTATICCLTHKAVNKCDVQNDGIDLAPLTEELAEQRPLQAILKKER